MDIRKLQRVIVDGLEDVKAQNIVVFNTEHLSPLFERVIVASGTSNRQTKSLAASVRVVIHTTGGGSFDSGEISGTRGDAATALASHELEAKFMDCTTGMAYLDRGGLYRSLQMLDRCEDVSLLG